METKQTENNINEPALADFKPVKILDLEISQPLPAISSLDVDGKATYQRAMALTRLHSYPLGLLTIDFAGDNISADQLARHVWLEFGSQINQHLHRDGFPTLKEIPIDGIGSESEPPCLAVRRNFLSDAPMVSVVISTRERVKSLANALNSVLALDYPNFEVILVDNAPKTEATHEYFNFIQPVFQRNNISLRYVREDTAGLAVAHNRGLEFVRSPFVAFTDDDVVVDKNWLTEIAMGFGAAPSVGCVTGLVVPVELETPAQVLFEEYGGFIKGFDQRVYDLNGYRSNHPLYPYSPGHFGTGANMAFRTESLKKAGGFDPALGIGTPSMGADDLAAFFQTIINGNQLVYQPSAVIFHQHRRNYEGLRKQMYGYGTGLTVFLLKCILDKPALFFDLAPKIPLGLKYAFAPGSPKNSRKSASYPRELEWIERKGMLYGPFAYLVSWWRYRHYRAHFSNSISLTDPSASQRSLVNDWVDNAKREKSTKEV